MGIAIIPAPSSGGATTPIGATELLYSGAAPYGGTSLTGLSLAAGTYAIVVNQQNAERGLLTTANNGTFNLDGNRPTYVTLTTTETTFDIGGGISTGYANIQIGRGQIQGLAANSTDTLWVASIDEAANGTYRLRFSTNFLHWRNIDSPPSSYNNNQYLYPITRRLENYIAVGRNSTSNNFAFTTNGTDWTTASMPGSTFWRGNVFDYSSSLGRWLAHTDHNFSDNPAGGRAAISTNGTTWTEISAATLGFNSTNSYAQGCAIGPTATAKYVVVGTVGATTPRIMSSTDGTTWTSRTIPTLPAGATGIQTVVWSDTIGTYLAYVSGAPNTFVNSTDGITWTTQTIDVRSPDTIDDVGGIFWMNAGAESKIAWSTNATTWNYVKRQETGTYFPENGFTADSSTHFLPRYNGKGADRFMSNASDNSQVYGGNKHIRISWEPLTYMIYSTNITNV